MESTTLWKQVKREPFRIFFVLSGLSSILGALFWMIYAGEGVQLSAIKVHTITSLSGFVIGIIIGAVLTAMVSFDKRLPLSNWQIGLLLTLHTVSWIAPSFGLFELSYACLALLTIMLLVLGAQYYLAAERHPVVSVIFLVSGLVQGATGCGLLLLADAAYHDAGWKLLTEGMLLALVLSCIPMYKAVIYAGSLDQNSSIGDWEDVWRDWRKETLLHRIISLLGAGALFVSYAVTEEWVAAVRAIGVSLYLILFTGIWKLPVHRCSGAVFLWVGLWFFALGFMVPILFPSYRIMAHHMMYIAGLGNILLMLSLHMVLVYQGLLKEWYSGNRSLFIIGMLIICSLAARMLALFEDPGHYKMVLAGSALFWLAAQLIWFAKIAMLSTFIPYDFDR